jgi:hypothetical protein
LILGGTFRVIMTKENDWKYYEAKIATAVVETL